MPVPIKLTNFEVRASASGAKPLTAGFYYEGPGKDQPREGIEIDITAAEAMNMARILHLACVLLKAGNWPVRS